MTVGATPWADVLEDHPALGRPAAELATPAMLVDLDVLERNIATTAAFFTGRPARLRPRSTSAIWSRSTRATAAPPPTCTTASLGFATARSRPSGR